MRREKTLIRGRQMICPRCKTYHDILRFKPLQQIDEYVHETVPVYICPGCRWKFAPAPSVPLTDVVSAEGAA
jgi:hypothetical protein